MSFKQVEKWKCFWPIEKSKLVIFRDEKYHFFSNADRIQLSRGIVSLRLLLKVETWKDKQSRIDEF